MKVYVDELPKDCIDCPCECEYYCNLLNEDVGCCKYGEIHKDCPLQSLADYTKQVREEVVEDFYDEIRHRAILEDDYCPDHNLERKYGVRKCLLENIRTTILKKYGYKNESNND